MADASVQASPRTLNQSTTTEASETSCQSASHVSHCGPNVKYDVVVHGDSPASSTVGTRMCHGPQPSPAPRKGIEKPPRRSRMTSGVSSGAATEGGRDSLGRPLPARGVLRPNSANQSSTVASLGRSASLARPVARRDSLRVAQNQGGLGGAKPRGSRTPPPSSNTSQVHKNVTAVSQTNARPQSPMASSSSSTSGHHKVRSRGAASLFGRWLSLGGHE